MTAEAAPIATRRLADRQALQPERAPFRRVTARKAAAEPVGTVSPLRLQIEPVRRPWESVGPSTVSEHE